MEPYIIALKLIEWIEEDSPFGDLTSEILVPRGLTVEASIIAKSNGIAACFNDIASALSILGLNVIMEVSDGEEFREGTVIMRLRGEARKILLYERTILNLMSFLSGIATKTRRLVNIVKNANPRVRVAATRKVVPGLRALVKKAVALGGGDTHRFSLSDAVLIKDNHLAIIGDVEKAVKLAKARASFIHKVEVEVTNPYDALKAARAGADAVLLDNMNPEDVGLTIRLLEEHGLRRQVLVEVSGGIDEDNIVEYASKGPDVISTSAITMRPDKVDLSLEVDRVV